jgi:hypothetical protein
MRAAAFWKAVTMDEADFLRRMLDLLEERGIRYCVIGGQGVNAYAEPLVSLDLDIVVATDQIADLAASLAGYTVKTFPHSINNGAAGSNLRVQIQRDPRYAGFLERASERDVLGFRLPVAAVEDVLQGKIWAVSDTSRRGSKRQKDLADIARLLEAHPELRARVPAEILGRLI